MPFKTNKVLFVLGLAVSPLVVLAGCGGGGDGLSPTPTPTRTSLPFPQTTATSAPTPTVTPIVSDRFTAAFTDVTAPKVGSGFVATDFFNDNLYSGHNGQYAGSLSARLANGGINNRRIEFLLQTKPGQVLKTGDLIPLSNDYSNEYVSTLGFTDFPNKLPFTAKSGTVRIDSLVKGSPNVRFTFTIINAIMIPSPSSPSDNKTGQFTLNGSGSLALEFVDS